MDLNKSFIRIKEVMERTTLSKSTIYRLMDRKEFPKPIKLRGMGDRVVLWVNSEVDEWIENQIATCRIA